jgi:RNA polymerase sigma factor (sigma-70 family)
MTEADDIELLQQYARENSEEAFAALVGRHVHLVYSVALRRAGNPHAAEEITQAVFIILARKAKGFSRQTILTGWLHQTARLTAANYLRTEIRRQHREQEAYMQSALSETETWTQIAPLLDDAVARLGGRDRDAILLRYFENKSACEMAAALRIDPSAAQKRVTRAVEKLRTFFAKRGVTLTAAAIAGAVSANSIQAAPVGLAATVTATAAKGAAVSASTLTLIKGALKIMAWAKMKTAIVVGAAILLASTTGIVTIKAMRNSRPPQKLEMRTFRVDPNQPILKTVANYFASKGMDFRPPKSIAFSSQLGLLFVKATPSDMNAVERILWQLNALPPQVHIKAYFIKVPESDVESILKTGKALGSADKNIVEVMTANQATLSLRKLESFVGTEVLGEPEIVTASGRQSQMRAGNVGSIPTVDLIPEVFADNCAVKMKVKVIVSAPETLTAQAKIWDGQTLLLGSQNSDGKNRLLVFITTTLVDPAGNKFHADDELPFAKTSIPQQ